jgi:hypothetical protein
MPGGVVRHYKSLIHWREMPLLLISPTPDKTTDGATDIRLPAGPANPAGRLMSEICTAETYYGQVCGLVGSGATKAVEPPISKSRPSQILLSWPIGSAATASESGNT